jgi:Na+-translocating ferredoxin:NAD+ oxidoreductase RnfD subunit
MRMALKHPLRMSLDRRLCIPDCEQGINEFCVSKKVDETCESLVSRYPFVFLIGTARRFWTDTRYWRIPVVMARGWVFLFFLAY